MKNKHRNRPDVRSLKSDVRNPKSEVGSSVVRLLFSVFCLLFSVPCLLSGCGGASRSLLGDFYVTNVASAQSEAKHVISDALADSDPVAKVNAIEVVGTTGRVDFMRRVQRLLRDQSVPVRFAASLAVGDLQYAPAQRSLRPLLQDPDANVIVAASYAMGRLGSPEYYQVVRKAAQSKAPTVRANAVLLLGKIGDRSALKLLKSVQEDEDSTDKVRFQVLQARARLGDEEVLRRLWALVYSAYADDRVLAIQAIGALGTSRARDILATKLDDVVLEVRLAAAGQLGKLGDKSGQAEVLDVFEKNLTSGMDKQASERVNVLAALAIGEIRTAALTKYLPQLLKNESKYVRIAAAKAVFQCNMR
jgi:HEAT repeat protein